MALAPTPSVGDGILWFPQDDVNKGYVELSTKDARLALDLPAETRVPHRIAVRYANGNDNPAPCLVSVSEIDSNWSHNQIVVEPP